jgi:hypothetical protein
MSIHRLFMQFDLGRVQGVPGKTKSHAYIQDGCKGFVAVTDLFGEGLWSRLRTLRVLKSLVRTIRLDIGAGFGKNAHDTKGVLRDTMKTNAHRKSSLQ